MPGKKVTMSTATIKPNDKDRKMTPRTPMVMDDGRLSVADNFFRMLDDVVLESTISSFMISDITKASSSPRCLHICKNTPASE
ncbi:hypothetical protein CHS0354_039924 [Potamilus streckersoni]|uniref:Uncharacterized protein n=1 Tax=Potamilus streckersoni TaxID=2493646 RepID=A0AAE0THM0_9BIVA|nr:hypothetical protein CHS0354_039924 [Potamilus streckersoni]